MVGLFFFKTHNKVCEKRERQNVSAICSPCVLEKMKMWDVTSLPLQWGPSSQPSVQSGTPSHTLLIWIHTSRSRHPCSLTGHWFTLLCVPVTKAKPISGKKNGTHHKFHIELEFHLGQWLDCGYEWSWSLCGRPLKLVDTLGSKCRKLLETVLTDLAKGCISRLFMWYIIIGVPNVNISIGLENPSFVLML